MKSSNRKVNIRKATPQDVQRISKLFHEIVSVLPYYTRSAKISEYKKYTPYDFEKLLAGDRDSVLLAFNDNEELLGYSINHFEDYVIWIDWIGVRASARKLNVGSSLVRELSRIGRKRNCHKIWCDTRTTNNPAIAFFRKLGFRKIGKVRKHWFGLDFYLWEKFI